MVARGRRFGASLLVVLGAGCSAMAGTGADTCAPDPAVACTGDSSGFSCTGADTPAQGNSLLVCSAGVPGAAGATRYCCTSAVATSTCAPNAAAAGCPAGATSFACTGVDTPAEGDPSLSCGPGSLGAAGETVYCCTVGANDAGVCAPGAVGAGCAGDASSMASGTCAVDATVTRCEVGATGYSCTGSATPSQADPSLGCGLGTAGAGVTTYCCTRAQPAPDAGCAVRTATANASCDECLESQCCAALVACDTPDGAGSDDAGATACEQLVQCTLDCLAGSPDAGVDGGSLADCQGLCEPSYTAPERQTASAFVQCLTTQCPTQCQ